LALSATSANLPMGLVHEAAAADVATTVIERYREWIPQLMAEQGIPGWQSPSWTPMGAVGRGVRPFQADILGPLQAVTPTQSVSKVFTATAR
jgi:hypothetical protein